MTEPSTFHAYSAEHLLAIALILALPCALAAAVRAIRWRYAEMVVDFALSVIFVAVYIGQLVFVRRIGQVGWTEMLPMQMCDWALVVVLVALWSKNHRWFEIAYFWGIGGTLQAILTPDLRFGFPDPRFLIFFVAHGGIIVGVIFLMLRHRLRPYPFSIVRAFAWSEFYFICALTVDLLTGLNYGFLLHKPQAQTLLSVLSDSWPIYLLQMHLLALVFFVLLYLPFAVFDLFHRTNLEGTPA